MYFLRGLASSEDAHPLYQFLKHEKRGTFWTTAIKWNFTKFLVDRAGESAIKDCGCGEKIQNGEDASKIIARRGVPAAAGGAWASGPLVSLRIAIGLARLRPARTAC